MLLTVPKLGVEYNAHVIEAILKHVAPGLRMALTPFPKAHILYAGMLPLLGAVPKYSTMGRYTLGGQSRFVCRPFIGLHVLCGASAY